LHYGKLKGKVEETNALTKITESSKQMPFYILTSNPQLIRGNLYDWKIARFGHASKGSGNTKINNEIRGSLSRKRITVSMEYIPTQAKFPTEKPRAKHAE
jgi:hypothetical protein